MANDSTKPTQDDIRQLAAIGRGERPMVYVADSARWREAGWIDELHRLTEAGRAVAATDSAAQPLSPEEIEAVRARERAATAEYKAPTFGYNNGGCPTMFLPIPGHNGGKDVEMMEGDALFVFHSRADVRRLLATLDARDAEIAQLHRCRHERDVLATEIVEAATKAGGVDPSIPLTGPQVVLLVRDMGAEIARLRACNRPGAVTATGGPHA